MKHGKPDSRRQPLPPNKTALDDATPYTTFLPAMDEGFHMGYKAVPGILSDASQKPGEWLENFAKYIRTQGEDVGYSIPDVLASEQQLRRLSRLPHDIAMRHQEMLDYRAVLALLLLWDLLASDAEAAALTLDDALNDGERDGFSQAVRSALSPARAEEGLRVFALSRPRSETPDKTPLCLLSRAMVLMPAANLGDLSQLLPPAIKWYDRERKRFLDPCPFLDEKMRSVLVPRLRLLQALNEDAAAGSPVYSPEAHLCALIGRLIADVLAQREGWRARLVQGDPEAEEELRTRVLAVYGLGKRDSQLRLTVRTLSAAGYENNPLLRQLLPPGQEPPPYPAGEEVALYFLQGEPFARRSVAYLLEPAEDENETETLTRLRREIALLDNYDEGWRREMEKTLSALAERLAGRTGVNQRVPQLLRRWAKEYADTPSYSDWEAVLRFPQDCDVATLSPLLTKMLGAEAESCVRKPFSDCLLLIPGEGAAPLPGLPASACRVQNADPPAWYVPPLSPEMAAWLENRGETDDSAAPRLLPASLFCRLTADGAALEAGFSVVCRVREESGDAPGKVTFLRTYPLRTLPESGAAFQLAGASLPRVAVWPNLRLNAERWRQYYIHTHHPEAMDVWALSSSGWVQGDLHTAGAQSGAPETGRSWRTACTDRFPAYVVLKRGAFSLGALVNDQPTRMLRREDAAVVGLDFGSIATTVMLRQGEKLQPALLPAGLCGALLAPERADNGALTDEFMPPNALEANSTFFSVMDMFTDDPAKWQNVLRDGHIYYPASLTALLQKEESALYYDLKWSEEDYVLRCLRLFLKQAMVQAALSARLWGSASLSWRVSMPGALPPHRQEAYLALMRGLAREVAEESGMPLTPACPPVLYAAENQADGLYFRSRNEVNARNGYLNLDLGGGTADLSLWLNNAVRATAECSLLMGCRHILYASVANGHVQDFEADFGGSDTPMAQAAREIAKLLRTENATTRGRQKGMLLMDDFFAAYAPEIRAAMAAARAQGKITYTEALLLLNAGFLFHLCGLLLQRAYEEEELRPLLPKRLELCVAGNGGQLLKALSQEQMNGLCALALQALCREHPVTALLPVQSADPKREVALGLLNDDGGLQSALQSVDRWNGTPRQTDAPRDAAEWAQPITDYLARFCRAFPLAANRLLRDVCETDAAHSDPRLTAVARMELHTILENERTATPEDDMTAYTRCFAGLKRLWKI